MRNTHSSEPALRSVWPTTSTVSQPDPDMSSSERIVVRREALERLELLLQRSYSRHQMREIKQAVDTVHHLLAQSN